MHQHMYTQIQQYQYKILFGDSLFKQYMITYTCIVISIYVTYIIFCSTNLQILDYIWVVIAQMFCMLQPTIQHLVKKFLLLWMNQNIQGEPACIVLLTMFV